MRPEDFYTTYLHHPQICTDSRKVIPGCLYFALRGDHFNGNQFAKDALLDGSSFVIVDDPLVVENDRYILVPDVLRFLQDLAAYHRNQLHIPVIGLTGTNGKTTTKELIISVLKQKYRVMGTSGNLNNHIGVPLTVLSAGQEDEILVVEMGANHPGEIAFLCEIAHPDFGLITNIGKAHLEGFGSYEGVIRTKNELYQSVIADHGRLFINSDDELLKSLAGDYPSMSYGTTEDPAIQGRAAGSGERLAVEWKTRGAQDFNRVISHLTGNYNLYNILAAISIGAFFGLTEEQIHAGIEAYVPANMRSQWIETGRNSLFLDAYNANPSSMELAIRHFAELKLPQPIVILGDMFELGAYSAEEHLAIIKLVEELALEKVIFVGKDFLAFSKESGFLFFLEVNLLKEYLILHPLTGCQVMIKGSRGMQLERLVELL